jgi:two-component system nitrogen regulation sensor histidine kinase NtrY
VTFTFEIPDTPMPAALDRQMIHQVVTNIVRNAIQAIMSAGGHGQVRLKLVEDGEYFAILIDDDGPGVPDEMRTSIFDPYFTTKTDGTGLGLAIVKKIVVEHGGTIDVSQSDLGGASFRIRIPRLTSPAARAVREMRPSHPGPGVRSP